MGLWNFAWRFSKLSFFATDFTNSTDFYSCQLVKSVANIFLFRAKSERTNIYRKAY